MKQYYAITGRIPDEENHTLITHTESLTHALRTFERALYRGIDKTPAQVRRQHGDSYYVESVVSSATPLLIHRNP